VHEGALGINIFLDGFVPTENMRFREMSLSFKIAETAEENADLERHRRYKYPAMHKTLGAARAGRGPAAQHRN
jgi:ATP-binding cassette, sub-family E, member 1